MATTEPQRRTATTGSAHEAPSPAGAWRGLDPTSRLVALEVLRHGPLSRSDVARRLGLSAGTLTRLARALVAAGVLTEGPPARPAGAGRPGRPLEAVAGAEAFVGVRVTDRDLVAVRTDLRARELAHETVELDSTSPRGVIAAISSALRRLATAQPVAGLGVALGGTVETSGAVARAPFLGWEEPVDLAARLEAATGLVTSVSNDLVALTTAEQWFGVGAAVDDLAVVTTGVGVGGGLVTRGRVVARRDAGMGLLGHLPLGADGPRCGRGHPGCADALLTEASLLARASRAVGRPVRREELVPLGDGGSPEVGRVLDEAAAALGRLVGVVASTTLSPLVVVSGEGVDLVAGREELLQAGVRDARPDEAPEVEVVLRPADAARWARGAAAVAVQRHVGADAPG